LIRTAKVHRDDFKIIGWDWYYLSTILDDYSKCSHDGKSVQIDIYQDGQDGWVLEIVDECNNSTVWDDSFPTDVAALNEAHEAIEKEGMAAFRY